MGTWGCGPFENDAAMDWIVTARVSDPEHVRKVLSRQLGDADYEAVVVAAAAVVAGVVSGEPDAEMLAVEVAGKDVEVWRSLGPLAGGRLNEIVAGSELADLWRDADEYDEWAESIHEIERRLIGTREPGHSARL